MTTPETSNERLVAGSNQTSRVISTRRSTAEKALRGFEYGASGPDVACISSFILHKSPRWYSLWNYVISQLQSITLAEQFFFLYFFFKKNKK